MSELYIQTVYYNASMNAYKQQKYITMHEGGHYDSSKNNQNDDVQILDHVVSLYDNVNYGTVYASCNPPAISNISEFSSFNYSA
jgi:hypothetical protein